jgi:hypothetical protein
MLGGNSNDEIDNKKQQITTNYPAQMLINLGMEF